MGDKIIIETDFRGNFRNQSYKETGVGHMIGKLGIITEGTVEASVTVSQGQFQEQVQIDIRLGVSNIKSMTILQETAQQHKQSNRTNSTIV